MGRKGKRKASPPPAMTQDLVLDADEISRIVELTGVMDADEALDGLRKRRPNESTAPLVHLEDVGSGEEDEEDSMDGHMNDEDVESGFLATPLAAQIFFSVMWTVTLSFLFVLLDVMTHKQYGDSVTAALEARRLANFLPGLFILVFASHRYAAHPALQFFFFLCSLLGGSYMVYLANVSSYLQVMRRCPPLGTLWIWACIQMDLLPTVLSLAGVAAFVRYKDLKIIFS